MTLVYMCVCMCLLLFTTADRDNREANFLHLQAAPLFQQEELANKTIPIKVQLISFDNLFINTHPVGYCPSIAIQKHKARHWLSPAPFLSKLTACLRVTKSKQVQHIVNAVSLWHIPTSFSFCLIFPGNLF